MQRGRPKSDNPRKHAVQTFLSDGERAALAAVRQWLSEIKDTEVSTSYALRACVAMSVAALQEGSDDATG
jgi:hypothetical protein